ncbi:hypothetical protein FKG94_21810 [Exilibacterium tricleocarpae]|uniref:Uncharacterized protein n=1 Tax=Exilibacterium tricleocarpae TaxID=2591008 RepID=A0A545SYY0_9GAMM|nr:hypothetical protein [Exilibacterium tricleocarpae]TQV70160.1 hypothetical protein FKG94_21810 [Exilibacterium tricleocarpae]
MARVVVNPQVKPYYDPETGQMEVATFDSVEAAIENIGDGDIGEHHEMAHVAEITNGTVLPGTMRGSKGTVIPAREYTPYQSEVKFAEQSGQDARPSYNTPFSPEFIQREEDNYSGEDEYFRADAASFLQRTWDRFDE